MSGVKARAPQAALLAEEQNEQDAALGMHRQRRQGVRDFHHAGTAAAVVIRAVVDPVFAGGGQAEMIVVRAEHHIGIAQLRIGSAQDSGDVAHLDGLLGWRQCACRVIRASAAPRTKSGKLRFGDHACGDGLRRSSGLATCGPEGSAVARLSTRAGRAPCGNRIRRAPGPAITSTALPFKASAVSGCDPVRRLTSSASSSDGARKDVSFVRGDRHRPAAGAHRHRETVAIRFPNGYRRRLKVAVVACRFESRASKLRRDVLRRQVQTS